MIKLVLFYSESEPFDKGINLTNEKNRMIERYKNDFDEIVEYSPRILKELGYDNFIKDYSNNNECVTNYKMDSIGCCAWKPLIVKLELEKANNNDIIVYHDINCSKYPIYLTFIDVKNTIQKILKECRYDFFIPQEENIPLYKHCKTNVIRELGENHNFNYNFGMLRVNFMIFKKTDISFKLLNEWIDACLVEKWINGKKYGEIHPEFLWHCPEQGILNNIIANWIRRYTNNIPIHYPFLCISGDRNINCTVPITNYNYLSFLNTRINSNFKLKFG
jgi:hypothetical protein